MNSHAKKLLEEPGLRDEVNQSALYAELVRTARRVLLGGKPHFLVEGDLALDLGELGLYALAREQPERAADFGHAPFSDERRGLVGIMEDGVLVRWPDGAVLSYAVERESFGDEALFYQDIVVQMMQATQDWQSACNIQFRYDDAGDLAGPERDACLFTVRYERQSTDFLALSFFPNDDPSRRVLRVTPAYFGPHGFDPTGILRHELGHVLGFRHEHIRSGAPPVCPGESLAGTVDLTQYDPRSVMHYFCGDVGSKTLTLTELDIAGAVKLYGPPR